MRLSPLVFWSWELELASAPFRSSYIRSFCGATTFFFNRGKSWIALAKMVSSAPAPLQLRSSADFHFKKFATAAYTCTGFLVVCDFRYSASGQDDELAWYSSPYFYWRLSSQLLGLFPQVHTKWEFVFTQFSRHLTFQEFSVPPNVYSVFNFDRFTLLWVTWLFF